MIVVMIAPYMPFCSRNWPEQRAVGDFLQPIAPRGNTYGEPTRSILGRGSPPYRSHLLILVVQCQQIFAIFRRLPLETQITLYDRQKASPKARLETNLHTISNLTCIHSSSDQYITV